MIFANKMPREICIGGVRDSFEVDIYRLQMSARLKVKTTGSLASSRFSYLAPPEMAELAPCSQLSPHWRCSDMSRPGLPGQLFFLLYGKEDPLPLYCQIDPTVAADQPEPETSQSELNHFPHVTTSPNEYRHQLRF
jgi:hypothetical protein